MAPLVSVLTTVYNREPYLAACIESVLAQSMGDLELIIVDDCSTDGSYSVAERYLSDSRVRLYRNETNLGDYPNRNRAASLATGRYLKYVDGDDLIYPHCLELMVHGMQTYPEAGYGISKGIAGVMAPALLTPRQAYRSHFSATGLLSVGPLDAILRRDAFEILGGFSRARHTGDTDFFLRLGARWPAVVLVPGLVWWRHHEEQESVEEGRSYERILEVTIRRHCIVYTALRSKYCPLSRKQSRKLRLSAIARIVVSTTSAARHVGFKKTLRYFKDAMKSPALQLDHHCIPQEHLDSDPDQSKVSMVNPKRPTLGHPHQANRLKRTQPRPLVSIILTMQPEEQAAHTAMESVLKQQYSQWEIVLAANVEAIERSLHSPVSIKESRIVKCAIDPEVGSGLAYRKGAAHASGEYLLFLSPRAWLYPHALRVMVSVMQHHKEAGIGISASVGPYRELSQLSSYQALITEFFATPMLDCDLSNALIRRTSYDSLEGLDLNYHPFERYLQFMLASRHPVVRLVSGLVNCPSHISPHFANYDEWPLGWATGIEWIIPWLKHQQHILSPTEAQEACARLLLYLSSGGEPRLGMIKREHDALCRETMKQLATQENIPLDRIVGRCDQESMWTERLRREEVDIIRTSPDLSLFDF